MESDSPTQYERDLRGANQEWKRYKDSARKWRLGEVPSPGVSFDLVTNKFTSGSEAQQGKVRPIQPSGPDPWKEHHNLVKLSRSNYGASHGHVKSKMGIHEELEANRSGDLSASDLPSPGVANDPFLYSFDRSVTPGQPVTLDVFVKAPTARDTERLVEKEYEVVDENGQALKGREAKRNLRKSSSNLAAEKSVDGFELV